MTWHVLREAPSPATPMTRKCQNYSRRTCIAVSNSAYLATTSKRYHAPPRFFNTTTELARSKQSFQPIGPRNSAWLRSIKISPQFKQRNCDLTTVCLSIHIFELAKQAFDKTRINLDSVCLLPPLLYTSSPTQRCTITTLITSACVGATILALLVRV